MLIHECNKRPVRNDEGRGSLVGGIQFAVASGGTSATAATAATAAAIRAGTFDLSSRFSFDVLGSGLGGRECAE
jgi:hypothetical protein